MNTTSTVFTILASAIVVLAGLIALTKAIWRAASDLRDNKQATVKNTAAITDLSTKMDGRITSLEARVERLEHE